MTDNSPTAKQFSRFPMFWLAAFYGVGIAGSQLAGIDLRLSLGACVFSAAVGLVFSKTNIAAVFIAIAFAAAGAASLQMELQSVRSDRIKLLYDGGIVPSRFPVEVEGVLMGRPEPSFDGSFLTLRTERLRYAGSEHAVSGNIRLFAPAPSDAKTSDEDAGSASE